MTLCVTDWARKTRACHMELHDSVCHKCVHDFYVQVIADRVALNLEIISKIFSTKQNSAHGIYD